MQNWIKNSKPSLSLKDMVDILLQNKDNLVLCQVHELERIRLKSHRDKYKEYIISLYNHYIEKKLPKTYQL